MLQNLAVLYQMYYVETLLTFTVVEKFIYKSQGRRYRLTDVHGQVIKDILA